MKKFTIALTICLSSINLPFTAFARTQTIQKHVNPKLETYLKSLEKHNKAMFNVAFDAQNHYHRSIGYASVIKSLKNNSQTRFRIGSISKIFTAAMIFQLIEEGKLSLKTPLSDFFDQVPNAKNISVKQLLGHKTGLHNFTNDNNYLGYMSRPQSQTQMLKMFAETKSDTVPGKAFSYSNTNYVLLGYIIEKLRNKTYAQVLQEKIVSPLKLNNTYFGSTPALPEAMSYRYEKDKWKIEAITDMSIPHGAGAIVSTPKELNQFIKALFNGKLISQKSLEAMMPKDKAFYGLGLLRFTLGKKIGYGHNGGIDGFVSSLAYFPKDDLAFSVTANGINTNFNTVLIGLVSLYTHQPFELPDFGKQVTHLSSAQLKKYEGTFATKTLPLKIKFKEKGELLYGQATGQGAFPLQAFSTHEFRFEQAGIIIIFGKTADGKVNYKEFTLKQGGGKHLFKREP